MKTLIDYGANITLLDGGQNIVHAMIRVIHFDLHYEVAITQSYETMISYLVSNGLFNLYRGI